MNRFLIALTVVSLLAVAPRVSEAGPLRRIAARVRHPFNGNGVPVVRRVTGQGGNGGCANGMCR